jgi:hypothetical protein
VKTLLAILVVTFSFFPICASEINAQAPEIILPASPPQKVYSRYQTNFAFHHDRGLYFSAALGPQWNHSIDKPKSQAIRFGGKINLGGFVASGFSLFGSVWGNFLEAASLIAVGPGMALLFDKTNIGIDFSLGLGSVMNLIERPDIKNFNETVLATNLALSKYWWLSSKTSLGISLMSGIHGFTLTEGKLGSIGWNVGLGLAFLLG